VDARAEVKNAADKEQVKRAARKEVRREDRRLDAYRSVLGTSAGRMVFDDLLARFGAYRSIWHPSALIHYNAGKQDAAHELLADLIRADEELVDLMNREARERRRADARETDAAHASFASQEREQ
jgi:hypothetical protein